MNSLLQQTTQAFLEALMILPRETWNEYIDQFAEYIAKEFSAEYEDIKAEYNKQAEKIIMMVDSVDVDILDVTGLEPQQARQLALNL